MHYSNLCTKQFAAVMPLSAGVSVLHSTKSSCSCICVKNIDIFFPKDSFLYTILFPKKAFGEIPESLDFPAPSRNQHAYAPGRNLHSRFPHPFHAIFPWYAGRQIFPAGINSHIPALPHL